MPMLLISSNYWIQSDNLSSVAVYSKVVSCSAVFPGEVFWTGCTHMGWSVHARMCRQLSFKLVKALRCAMVPSFRNHLHPIGMAWGNIVDCFDGFPGAFGGYPTSPDPVSDHACRKIYYQMDIMAEWHPSGNGYGHITLSASYGKTM
jgi:hypothetical protein